MLLQSHLSRHFLCEIMTVNTREKQDNFAQDVKKRRYQKQQ